MDCLKYITEFVILLLSFVLVSNQLPTQEVIECPLVDVGNSTGLVPVHNITRSASCKTGWGLAGCCVERMYCEFNTSNIDLTLFAPHGYRTSCRWNEVCCPPRYLQPIHLYNSTQNSDLSDDDDMFDENF